MLKILAYHHILSDRKENIPRSNRFISKIDFELQMQLLNEEYKVVQLLPDLTRYIKSSELYVAITIDDGYENFYTNGLTPLINNNLPATIFIPTVKIGKKVFEIDYNYEIQYLNYAQINDIVNSKVISVQAHGHLHNRLSEFSFLLQEEDIFTSTKILTEISNEKIYGFCYPYGQYNQDTKSILHAKDYMWACTTKSGANFSGQDCLELRRYAVNSQMTLDDVKNLLS